MCTSLHFSRIACFRSQVSVIRARGNILDKIARGPRLAPESRLLVGGEGSSYNRTVTSSPCSYLLSKNDIRPHAAISSNRQATGNSCRCLSPRWLRMEIWNDRPQARIQLHPNRRWRAAAKRQSRVYREVVIEKSHAKSSARPSKARSVEAVHLCGIAAQLPQSQGQPTTFL